MPQARIEPTILVAKLEAKTIKGIRKEIVKPIIICTRGGNRRGVFANAKIQCKESVSSKLPNPYELSQRVNIFSDSTIKFKLDMQYYVQSMITPKYSSFRSVKPS